MEITLTPNGEADENGIVPVTMGIDFKVEVKAEGHKREDGLTAAQVREEIANRK